MGQVLHRSATTTEAIRRAIQNSQASVIQALRRQPEDRRQVEEADLGGRLADRTEGTKVDGAVDRGGSDHRLSVVR